MNIDLGNYVGPYWSDGRVQPSVEWGESEPKHELDALARQHDSAYAKWQDREHREAADRIFADEARKLVGKFPNLAANLVQYGNYGMRQGSELASASRYGLPGILYFAGKNILKSHQMLTGSYLKKETQDVKEYYSTDPKLRREPPVQPRSQPKVFPPVVGASSGSNSRSADSGNAGNKLPDLPSVSTRPSKKMTIAEAVYTAAKPARPQPSKEEELRAEVLLASQKGRFKNYQQLRQAAASSARRQVTPENWNAIGYQGRINAARKRNKKNRVAPICM